MISIKIYKRGNDVLIGACDLQLLGKKFEDGKFQIDVRKEFYGGETIQPEIFKKYLENATIAINLSSFCECFLSYRKFIGLSKKTCSHSR